MDEGDRERCERLAEAVEEWGSVREFVAALRDRHVRGASQSSVYNYVNARTAPSIDFLAEAASVLGIRREWLLFGEGEHTSAEELGQVWEEAVEGLVATAAKYPPAVSGLLIDSITRLLHADPTDPKLSADQYRDLNNLLEDLSEYPLRLFWPHHVITEPEPAIAQLYAARLAALHAVHLAIPGRRQGRPVADILAEYLAEEGDAREPARSDGTSRGGKSAA